MEAGSTCAYMSDSVGAGGQAAPHPTLRLVIGENNADLATTLTMLFDAEPGIQCVAIAASGAAVVAALEAHSPNGFVLDLSLDDGSSLPLIATLRERSPRAVIVVHTGYKSDELEDRCLKSGADEVVLKTGDIDALTAALRRAALNRADG
jgi:DNA-binding NarL/FixJ family response regulator